jgi:hypothetical protein
MKQIANSLLLHVGVPYVIHLALATAAWGVAAPLTRVGLAMIGWIPLLGMALVSLPFAILHVSQAVRLAPASSAREKVEVGLLNPSFAILTIAFLAHVSPRLLLEA